jgi:hypothetical protein
VLAVLISMLCDHLLLDGLAGGGHHLEKSGILKIIRGCDPSIDVE